MSDSAILRVLKQSPGLHLPGLGRRAQRDCWWLLQILKLQSTRRGFVLLDAEQWAADLRCSRATVFRRLADLQRLGLFRRVKRARRGPRYIKMNSRRTRALFSR